MKLIDAERAEVRLVGSEQTLAGTYKMEKGESVRVVVTLPDASVKTYELNEKGLLVSPDTGALLARVPL